MSCMKKMSEVDERKWMVSAVLDMFARQEDYDQMVFKAHNIDGYKDPKLNIHTALFDELGELVHACKGDWCWWKHTQAAPDRDEVLMELADVMHFVLCFILIQNAKEVDNHYTYNLKEWAKCFVESFVDCRNFGIDSVGYCAGNLAQMPWYPPQLADLIKSLKQNFTFPEVYRAYCYKNDINRNRVKTGY